jgi:nucleotide-binding universal stress UspA family protein
MAAFRSILTIVNPMEEPDASVDHAVDLACRAGGTLKLIQTFEPLPWLDRLVHPGKTALRDLGREARRQNLEDLAASLPTRGVDLSQKTLFGRPEEEITWEVIRGDHDLVMLSGRGPRASTAFSPLAVRLMRVCPCAVLVVQPDHRPPFRRVLAAVDPDPGDPTKEDLARRTIGSALELAHDEDAECFVLHAWAPHDEEAIRKHLDCESFRDYRRRLREAANDALQGSLESFRRDLGEDSCILCPGDPRDVIPRLVREREIDLVVMGTVARQGLHGLLIGNTAEAVLRKSHCSVLSLKPEGFQSPICS